MTCERYYNGPVAENGTGFGCQSAGGSAEPAVPAVPDLYRSGPLEMVPERSENHICGINLLLTALHIIYIFRYYPVFLIVKKF